MEYDLPRGLHDLAQTPAVGPPAPDDVIARVRRGRALRTTAVALAGAAVVIGAAALVNIAPWDTTPVPPATPTPAPTQDHTPEPTPDPTPEPTGEPEPTEPPIVALTTAGELIILDPATGATVETVASDPAWQESFSISTDGDVAYLSRRSDSWYEIVRVVLADGASTVVTDGWFPAISPDGSTLVFAGRDPDVDISGQGLTFLDLVDGTVRHVPPSAGPTNPDVPLGVDNPTWSLDGLRVYVGHGYPEGKDLLAVDATTATLDTATRLGPPQDSEAGSVQSWELPAALADGRLAVFAREAGYDPDPSSMHIAVLDPLTGATVERIDVGERWVSDIAARPGAPGLAVVLDRTTLALWDGVSLRDVRSDIIAAAW